MLLSELIQALLDIQALASEDVEVKSVLFDEYLDEFKDTSVLLPVLMHHPDSLDQVCVFGMTEDTNILPEKGSHHLIRYMDEPWTYGKCDIKWLSFAEREALKNAG